MKLLFSYCYGYSKCFGGIRYLKIYQAVSIDMQDLKLHWGDAFESKLWFINKDLLLLLDQHGSSGVLRFY